MEHSIKYDTKYDSKYSNYIITDTTVWGQYHFAYDIKTKMRIIKKAELLHKNSYPFIDHYKIYALKPPKQKGPAREEQTFLISYAYNYDRFIGEREAEFITRLKALELTFYKKKCVFKEKDAYIILIMDTEANLDKILEYMKI